MAKNWVLNGWEKFANVYKCVVNDVTFCRDIYLVVSKPFRDICYVSWPISISSVTLNVFRAAGNIRWCMLWIHIKQICWIACHPLGGACRLRGTALPDWRSASWAGTTWPRRSADSWRLVHVGAVLSARGPRRPQSIRGQSGIIPAKTGDRLVVISRTLHKCV